MEIKYIGVQLQANLDIFTLMELLSYIKYYW